MKMKKGFTLAEVLIALALVGVITAITLPMVMTNHHYKTVGVRLAKFANQVESAALPYVAAAGAFSDKNSITKFVDETFIVTETTVGNLIFVSDATQAAASSKFGNADVQVSEKMINAQERQMQEIFEDLSGTTANNTKLLLKDGTAIAVNMLASDDYKNHTGVVNKYKVGSPRFAITFYPNIPSLPSFVQKNFDFAVTELGYVYPSDADDCLWAIFNSDYVTTAHTFNEGSVCVAGSASDNGGGNLSVNGSNSSGASSNTGRRDANSERYRGLDVVLKEKIGKNTF